MTTVAAPSAPAATTRGAGCSRTRRPRAVWLGLLPFLVYVVLFLAVPAIIAVASGFFDSNGVFTFANLKALTQPQILNQFIASFGVSAVTAVVGAVAGSIICFALMGTKPDGVLRSVVDAASSVLAQFGGVMLAFAFIALIGTEGLLTKLLEQAGWLQNPLNHFGTNGTLLYQVPGLTIPYLYFQVPLMVLTFMPAMEGLKTTWGEANATLGGTRFTYWTRIAMPILAPAFFGSMILLFANAFSSYATAAALISQGGIIPLAIKQATSSETVVGIANVAGVLALGMVIVMVLLMSGYALLQRRASRWQR